jgi:hypothetical protein
MADADKTLKLLIELGVLGKEEAEAANSLLDEAKQSTAALAKEMGVLTESADEAEKILAKTGEAAKGVGDAAEKGGEGVHGFNLHGRETFHLAEMLNRVLPGSGEALKAVANSGDQGTMALLGLTAVIEIISNGFEELSRNAKAADEGLAAILDEKYDADAIRGVADAWEKAATAQEIYRLGLAEKEQDENDPTKGAADRALRAAKSYETAQQQINAAQQKLGEASIEEMEKKGVITHQQALLAKLQLDEAYEKRRLELATETDAKEIDIKQRTADIVAKQKATAETGEAAAENNSAKADAAVAHVKTEIKKTEQDKAAAKEEMDKSGVTSSDAQTIRELYEKAGGKDPQNTSLQGMADWLRTGINHDASRVGGLGLGDLNDLRRMFTSFLSGGRDISDAQIAAYEGGEGMSKRTDSAQVKMNATLALREHDAELAKHELERQKHLLDEKSAQLDKLQQEVDTMKAEAQAREQNNATVAGIKYKTEAVKSGIAQPVNPFAPPPRAAAEPPPPPDTSYRAAEGAFRPQVAAVDINGLIAALNMNEQQKNKVLDHIHNVTKDSLAAWNALERKWEELQSQIKHSSNCYGSG